jgi:hypothetical protein
LFSFIPPDWQASLGAGAVLMVIELIIVYLTDRARDLPLPEAARRTHVAIGA